MSRKSLSEAFNEKKLAVVIYLEHNKTMAKILTPVRMLWRMTGLGHVLNAHDTGWHDKQDRLHEDYMHADELHKQELSRVSEMLEDDLSRLTLEKVLAFRRTWDKHELEGIISSNEYFPEDILTPCKDEVFVDGGAYVGDTIDSFLRDFAGGGYKKIYAWEPDEANLKALEKNTSRMDNVVCLPCGLWREKTELRFLVSGDMSTKVADGEEPGIVSIKVDSIDNVCAGDKVTFIKLDIEGCELEALKGAVNVIKRDKPRLAICVYHKPEDLYEIPFWIRQTIPEYKLYLRHYGNTVYDTVLYATL